LGSPKPEVSLHNDFELSYLARPNVNDVVPLPSLEQESDSPLSLSPDLEPVPSSDKDITDDVLIYADPPVPFNYTCEFEVDEHLTLLVS